MKQEDVLRKCIVSGKVQEKSQLLRFVLTPDLNVIPDFKKKLPGKGIYVKNSKEALLLAIEKNLFSKAAKQKIKVDSSLVEMVEAVLRKKGLESISIARKAGVLVSGLEKVIEVLKKEKVAFVLEAGDAGCDGHNRVMLAAKNLDVFRLYSIEELDTALNKTNTVHIAFKKSDVAKMVYNEFKRLESFLDTKKTDMAMEKVL